MRYPLVVLLFLILIAWPLCGAQEKLSGVALFEAVTDFAKGIVPKSSVTCALSTIEEVIRPGDYILKNIGGSVHDSNRGFMAFLDKTLNEDQCVDDVGFQFWRDLNKDFPTKKEDTYPNLSEEAGKGRFYKLKPGWLLDRAMKAANKDPEFALLLIAMCTHDNTNNQLHAKVSARVYKSKIDEEVSRVQAWIPQIEREANSFPQGSQEQERKLTLLGRQKEYLESLLKDREDPNPQAASIGCQEWQGVSYVPKSLSTDVDLPTDFKNEIARIQAPTKGATVLPAKTFHFHLSAYMGCRLAQCGLSPEMTSKLTAFIGRSYRNTTQSDSTKFNLIKDKLQREENRLDMIADDPEFPKKTSMTNEELATIDALKIQNAGMDDETAWDKVDPMKDKNLWPQGRPPKGTLCHVPGWSVSRCDNARAKLRTWKIDLKWTEMQHRIGGKFGATLCTENPVRKKNSKRSCESDHTNTATAIDTTK